MSTTPPIPPRRKLIEVALPLEAINRESAREKSIRHGHPSTLHLWWARRPLAACRAVLFSSLVDDPSSDPHLLKPDGSHDEDVEGDRRANLFNLIEELVKWENSNEPKVIDAARTEIARSVASRLIETGVLKKDQPLSGGITPWDLVVHGKVQTKATLTKDAKVGIVIEPVSRRLPAEAVNAFLAEHAPPVLDPFCGGGSIPLEAQRLGLRAFGSDLNPVPVLITKALIEIPPKFANRPPVNPESRGVAGAVEVKGTPDAVGGKGKGKKKETQGQLGTQSWRGAAGLAEDVRYYGRWMRDEAQKRIGHLYPKITVTEAMARDRKDLKDYIGQDLTVIAWLWARTVPSPNPAASGAHVPLVRSFWLSMKEGKKAWAEPVIAADGKSYKFEVRSGTPGKDFDPKKGTVIRTGATCLLTNQPMPFEHVRSEAKSGRMGAKLMAIVAEGTRGRVYLSPTPEHEKAAEVALPKNIPDTPIPEQALGFRVQLYGMDKHYKLFTHRQLVALTTLSDLAMEARARVLADARIAGLALAEGATKGGITGTEIISAGTKGVFAGTKTPSAGTETISAGTKTGFAGTKTPLAGTNGASEGTAAAKSGVSEAPDGAERYADAVATYLAEAASKTAAFHCTLAGWRPKEGKSARAFGRQNLAMNWDFAEVNPFADAGGGFAELIDSAWKTIGLLPAIASGSVMQHDAAAPRSGPRIMVSTDPPYYDNVGYADLSDFYYVWLRRSLSGIYPTLFRTVLTPKVEELIATPHRFEGDWDRANQFFESGMGRAFERMREIGEPDFPLTVYYAFKQSETDEDADSDALGEDGDRSGTASTGWETMLEGLIKAGFAITGTWPMRTESTVGLKMTQNVLASSIVLVCHPRGDAAPMASRREFVTALKRELPAALRDLQSGNIAPVDLAQAAIGPGMAVFSRYSKVIEASGERMGVRAALAVINQILDEVLAEQEGDFDADSRWAVAWFEQSGFGEGEYGVAETLSKAKNTSIQGLQEAGILVSGRGKVRLLKPTELPADWDPATDARLIAWEMVHHLIRALDAGGEPAAAALVAKLGGNAETARELCYRLYMLCERKKRATDAMAYNALVQSWPEISRLARENRAPAAKDSGLFSEQGA